MKKSKFTDSQIMDALERAEAGMAVPEICWKRGISTATFYSRSTSHYPLRVSYEPWNRSWDSGANRQRYVVTTARSA